VSGRSEGNREAPERGSHKEGYGEAGAEPPGGGGLVSACEHGTDPPVLS
jgi:hypothetical protein